MRVPRLVTCVVDPANVYFDDHSPRRTGRPKYATVVFGPGVAGGSREATPEEAEAIRRRAKRLRDTEDPAPELAFDNEQLQQAAADLISAGVATIGAPPKVVDARIVRFWRGDSILEVTYDGACNEVRSCSDLANEFEHADSKLRRVGHLKMRRALGALSGLAAVMLLSTACTSSPHAPPAPNLSAPNALVSRMVGVLNHSNELNRTRYRAECPSYGIGCWYIGKDPATAAVSIQAIFRAARFGGTNIKCVDPVRYCLVDVRDGTTGLVVRIARRHSEKSPQVSAWHKLETGSIVWADRLG